MKRTPTYALWEVMAQKMDRNEITPSQAVKIFGRTWNDFSAYYKKRAELRGQAYQLEKGNKNPLEKLVLIRSMVDDFQTLTNMVNAGIERDVKTFTKGDWEYHTGTLWNKNDNLEPVFWLANVKKQRFFKWQSNVLRSFEYEEEWDMWERGYNQLNKESFTSATRKMGLLATTSKGGNIMMAVFLNLLNF